MRGRGAKVLQGGGLRPLCPFYLGLYGGSELPGVLDSDAVLRGVLADRGYQEIDRTVLMSRSLDGFEAQINRQQMQIRRQMQVEVTMDAPTRTWWEACTIGEFELTRFDLIPRGRTPVASALFRSTEPSGTSSLCRAAGLIGLSVDPAFQRSGVATFLLNEAFRQFLRQGIVQVEAQATESNVATLGVLKKLGLQQTNHGSMWRKG